MTIVDGLILLLVAVMALQGYVRGFLVGVAGLVGFVAGAAVGTRVAAMFLSQGADSGYAPIVGLITALVLGGLVGTVFAALARRVRRFLWLPGLRLVDGLLGAALTACVGLALAWILGALALRSATSFRASLNVRHSLEQSVILRGLDAALPPASVIIGELGRIDPLGVVAGRVADVAAPAPRIVSLPSVRGAEASVVKVLGNACDLGIEGSGWVAGNGLVVTNAHVVAGERDTVVQPRGLGRELPASPVVFDPHNDIAVLRVPGLRAPVLRFAVQPTAGVAGAILGYPLDGPFERRPARLGPTQTLFTDDAYGKRTLRTVSLLRGLVRPGNSGGPVVNSAGEVLATVFAQTTHTSHGEHGGLAVPNSVVEQELAKARAAHGTLSAGNCAA